jgi:hypothetical protein
MLNECGKREAFASQLKGIQAFTQCEKSRDLLAFNWVMMRFRLDDELFFNTAYWL